MILHLIQKPNSPRNTSNRYRVANLQSVIEHGKDPSKPIAIVSEWLTYREAVADAVTRNVKTNPAVFVKATGYFLGG